MSASHLPELCAIAARLNAELAAYEPTVDRLMCQWDEAAYVAQAEQFGHMKLLARPLEQVNVGWIELLISRFELTEELLLQRRQPAAPGRLLGKHARHVLAIKRLRESLGRSYPAPGRRHPDEHGE